jgi:hypothetical protein
MSFGKLRLYQARVAHAHILGDIECHIYNVNLCDIFIEVFLFSDARLARTRRRENLQGGSDGTV